MGSVQENRKFSRVDFRITATARVGAKQLVGTVENLSLRGIFLATDQHLAVGDEAEITVVLSKGPEDVQATDPNEEGMSIEVDGRVARVTGDGIAFAFDKIDFDSYVHLKNLIALNIGDASKVEEEMEAFLDVHPAFLGAQQDES